MTSETMMTSTHSLHFVYLHVCGTSLRLIGNDKLTVLEYGDCDGTMKAPGTHITHLL